MSSYIVENKTISRIVNFLFWSGSDSVFRSENKRNIEKLGFNLFEDEGLNKLGQAMLEMNFKAVNQRYSTKDEVEEFKLKHMELKERGLHQVLKSIQCFLYQCSEGTVPRMKLYKTLKKIEKAVMYEIIDEMPEYKQAEWG